MVNSKMVLWISRVYFFVRFQEVRRPRVPVPPVISRVEPDLRASVQRSLARKYVGLLRKLRATTSFLLWCHYLDWKLQSGVESLCYFMGLCSPLSLESTAPSCTRSSSGCTHRTRLTCAYSATARGSRAWTTNRSRLSFVRWNCIMFKHQGFLSHLSQKSLRYSRSNVGLRFLYKS